MKHLSHLVLLLLILVTCPSTWSQEQFVKWLNDDQFVLNRVEDGMEKAYMVSLSNNKEEAYSGDSRASRQRYKGTGELTRSDGTAILLQDGNLFLLEKDGSEKQLTWDDAP